MSAEADKAIKLVYANTTKHDWPDEIWDAIYRANYAATSMGALDEKRLEALMQLVDEVEKTYRHIGLIPEELSDALAAGRRAIADIQNQDHPQESTTKVTLDDIYSRAKNFKLREQYMIPTSKLRFVERNVFITKPAFNPYGKGEAISAITKMTCLQQWWVFEKDGQTKQTGEWRDIPVEIEI